MNQKYQYHIDVTKDEDLLFKDLPAKPETLKQKVPLSLKKAFCVVLGVHVIGAVILFGLPQKAYTKSISEKAADPAATPFPLPVPSPVPSKEPLPEPATTNKPIPPTPAPVSTSGNGTKTSSAKPRAYTEYYVVKSGDNFNKIVKTYKLNPKQLIKLNDIKDTNKLQVGQKLKFM